MAQPVSHPGAGFPVVDAHVHVNRFDWMNDGPRKIIETNPTFPLMARFIHDPDGFLEHLDAEGIWQAWLINYSAKIVMGYGWEVNDWVAGYVQADPDRLVAVGGYDPRTDGEGALAMDRLVELGIKALKIHAVHQHLLPGLHREATQAGGRLGAAYARAQELGLPVIFHTGTSVFPGADNAFADPALVEPVLADFPDLSVILAHGGRPDRTAAALDLMDRYPNALLDLSSCPPRRLPDYFGGFAGLEALAPRTLWGSDWPGPRVPGMGANVDAFLRLGLPAKAVRAILRDNSQKLLARA